MTLARLASHAYSERRGDCAGKPLPRHGHSESDDEHQDGRHQSSDEQRPLGDRESMLGDSSIGREFAGPCLARGPVGERPLALRPNQRKPLEQVLQRVLELGRGVVLTELYGQATHVRVRRERPVHVLPDDVERP